MAYIVEPEALPPNRLPPTRPAIDRGIVYVTKRGHAYKIGFSRTVPNCRRRIRESEGEFVLAVQTGQRPSQLEYFINHRFVAKRLSDYWPKPGGKREWFALDAADLDWIRGLGTVLK